MIYQREDDLREMPCGKAKTKSWSTVMYSDKPPPQPAIPYHQLLLNKLDLHELQ